MRGGGRVGWSENPLELLRFTLSVSGLHAPRSPGVTVCSGPTMTNASFWWGGAIDKGRGAHLPRGPFCCLPPEREEKGPQQLLLSVFSTSRKRQPALLCLLLTGYLLLRERKGLQPEGPCQLFKQQGLSASRGGEWLKKSIWVKAVWREGF